MPPTTNTILSPEFPAHLLPALRGAGRRFWEAAAAGVLLLPRCGRCAGTFWHPRPRCPECGSDDVDWIEACGDGVVHTYTVVRQTVDAYFKTKLPYAVAMVELAEGPRLLSRIIDCDVDAVRIGLPVRAGFLPAAEGIALPVFRPAAEAGG